jgi:hypothetical protein
MLDFDAGRDAGAPHACDFVDTGRHLQRGKLDANYQPPGEQPGITARKRL